MKAFEPIKAIQYDMIAWPIMLYFLICHFIVHHYSRVIYCEDKISKISCLMLLITEAINISRYLLLFCFICMSTKYRSLILQPLFTLRIHMCSVGGCDSSSHFTFPASFFVYLQQWDFDTLWYFICQKVYLQLKFVSKVRRILKPRQTIYVKK